MPADTASPTPASIRSTRPVELMAERVPDILWVSAKEALVLALVVSVLGTIAIGILNGICGGMVPSLPPGLDDHPALTSTPAHWWHASRNAIHHHSFLVLFLSLFAAKSALRLAHFSRGTYQRRAAARVLWAARHISRHWFSLLVKNAFAAFIGVLVLQVVQRFSLTHFLWEVVGNVFYQVLGSAAGLVGASFSGLVERWVSWYAANQTKFMFWLLYSAGICDDLGLPNYKTLARRGWRRIYRAIQRRMFSRPNAA